MDTILYYAEINIASIVILSIILWSYVGVKIKSIKGKTFIAMIICTILFCLTDLFAGVFKGQDFPGARTILWICNIGYFVSMIAISYLWVIFCMDLLHGKVYKKVAISLVALAGAIISFNLTSPLHGLLYGLDSNNNYYRGDFLWVNQLFIYPLYFVGILFLFKSKAEKKDKAAALLYPIFPMITGILQLCFYGISVGQVGLTAAIVLMYVLLHGIEVNEQKIKVKVYDELSRTDTLTGLNNRRSYIKMIDQLSSSDWVGIIFLDINGLKEVNDLEGHQAGDQLLINYSMILKSLFSSDEIYRISGDEFVILTDKQNTFEEKIKSLIEINNDIASFGYSTCTGKELINNIRDAELYMYKSKSEYYLNSGKDRRH